MDFDAGGMRVGVRQSLKEQWRESMGAGVDERLEEVSADLPYELQSKMFDQLAAAGVAGAGLTVTLISSLLSDAPKLVWLPVILFGVAALMATSGNSYLIDGLFRGRPTLRRSKLYVGLSIGLIGMAVGSLSVAVYLDGERGPADVVGTGAAKAASG
jgi:hypothetical protein